MKKFLAVLMIFVAVLCAGCGENNFKSISQDEAQKMMGNPDVIVLDVRTPEEFEKKHIPNAILLPLEEIREGNFASLPDKNQKILVYCRTGRRSKEASEILVKNSYKNIYEFGGIVDWTGPVVGTDLE